MFKYNMINIPSFEINKNTIDKIFLTIYKLVNISQKWIINIVFLDSKSIKNLNNKYRNINSNTDVLSFHYYDDFSLISDKDTAWEIILSEKKILSQAIKYWLWNEKEFYKLIIHSILHILWYNHELDNDYISMQKVEDKIWQEVFEI